MDPYVTASKARRITREAKHLSDKKASKAAQYTLDLEEVRRQKVCLLDMETRLMMLTQDFTDHDISAYEEGTAIRHSSKKISIDHGASLPSSSAASSHVYASPTRINISSNKRSQVSSPAAHYTTTSLRSLSPANELGTQLTEYFGPGGGAQQALATAESISICVSSHKRGSINSSRV